MNSSSSASAISATVSEKDPSLSAQEPPTAAATTSPSLRPPVSPATKSMSWSSCSSSAATEDDDWSAAQEEPPMSAETMGTSVVISITSSQESASRPGAFAVGSPCLSPSSAAGQDSNATSKFTAIPPQYSPGNRDDNNSLSIPVITDESMVTSNGNSNHQSPPQAAKTPTRSDMSLTKWKREVNQRGGEPPSSHQPPSGARPGAHAVPGVEDDADKNHDEQQQQRQLNTMSKDPKARQQQQQQQQQQGQLTMSKDPRARHGYCEQGLDKGTLGQENPNLDEDNDRPANRGGTTLRESAASGPGAFFETGIDGGSDDDDAVSADYAGATVAPDVEFGVRDTAHASDDLAVARPIDDDDLAIAGAAQEYDPNKKPKVYKRRTFQVLLALFCLLAIGVSVGGGIAAVNKKKGVIIIATSAPTPAPTPAPTTANWPLFRSSLESSITANAWASSPQAYESALGWLSGTDPLERQPDDPLFTQRFVLAWLFYHTTKDGQTAWLSCNPAEIDAAAVDDTCVFQNKTKVSNDGSQIFYKPDNATRWLSGSHECMWPGIFCNPQTGAVIGIVLEGMNLHGEFPVLLDALPELQGLILNFNKLDGQLPSDLSGFNRLNTFSVMNNTLTGPIPDSLYSIPHLHYLGLGNNRFSGQLSPAIGNALQLRFLYLYGNNFSGELPEAIGRLSFLQRLYLEGNSGLAGSMIPASWGNLRDLRLLWLFSNGLAGSIPQEFRHLQNLQSLRLQKNQLTGPLPSMSAPGLKILEASENRFNGTIPDAIYNLTNLQILSFYKNRVSGPLKPALARKRLMGPRGPSIGNLQFLSVLAIYDNRLTGRIPVALANMTSLKTIWMHYNQFDGDVPIKICNLRGPQRLSNLTSDCWRPLSGDDKDYNKCYCCTDCCDRVGRDCGPANVGGERK